MDNCYHPNLSCNCAKDPEKCKEHGYECCIEKRQGVESTSGILVKNGTCNRKTGLCTKKAGKILKDTKESYLKLQSEGYNEKSGNILRVILYIIIGILIVVLLWSLYSKYRMGNIMDTDSMESV